jgi:K+-sensing histidine kinase KdpD
VADQGILERLLLLAPTARDGRVSLALFAQAGIHCILCKDIPEVCILLEQGAGAMMLPEEALHGNGLATLSQSIAHQAVWSDIPIIVLISSQTALATADRLHQLLGNCVLLERPVRIGTLLSAAQSALRSRRRQYQVRFLNEAGQLLITSLEQHSLLARLTALIISQLADACTVYLVEHGTLQIAAEAFANQYHAQLAARLQQYQPADSRMAPLWRIIEEQQPDLQEHIDLEALLKRLPDPDQQQIVSTIGVRSHVLMPLLVRGQAIGVLALAMIDSGRHFSAADLPFLHELAHRLAPVIDNLRLYAAEQQARHSAEQATKARDDLIAMVSHDLQNPLTALLGQSQLIRRRLAHDTHDIARIIRGVDAIERAALRMRSQIATLLDGIRARAGQHLELRRELVDLVPFVQAAVNTFRQTTPSHEIRFTASHAILLAEIDVDRMERVLDNLITNAIKYSPEGSIIAITLTSALSNGQNLASIEVQDAGFGIPADELAAIFEPFKRGTNVRDHIRGTGLGLASVQQIVESHGGRVNVTSQVSKGSTFAVLLPIAATNSTAV